MLRLLFASCHGYVDPSSGASQTTRDLLELLAARGHDCRVFSTGVLDFAQEVPLADVLGPLGCPVRRVRAVAGLGGTSELFDLVLHGVRVTLLPTASSRIRRSPDRAESATFLDLADQIFDRFRPDVLLTYGGHPVSRELIRRARALGIAVVFHLHNFAYPDRNLFDDTVAVLVPSEFSRRHHDQTLGLESIAIPPPMALDRVMVTDHTPRYLTFVNPHLTKGLTVFARIASLLDQRRPDIPILIVESRATANQVARIDLDLSGLGNLHRMANTNDPRQFYRVSRAVLMPSLWRESFGRVAAEALSNGIPVLASDRGALPETLGDAGIVLPVPDRCTPTSLEVPTPEEVAPWVDAIIRLWDDPDWYASHRRRALTAALRWDPDRLIARYVDFFQHVLGRAEGT